MSGSDHYVLQCSPTMLQRLKREPQGGSGAQIMLASGGFLSIVSLFLLFGTAEPTAPTLFAGMAIVGLQVSVVAVADLLPASATKLAGPLRIACIPLGIIGVTVVITALWFCFSLIVFIEAILKNSVACSRRTLCNSLVSMA